MFTSLREPVSSPHLPGGAYFRQTTPLYLLAPEGARYPIILVSCTTFPLLCTHWGNKHSEAIRLCYPWSCPHPRPQHWPSETSQSQTSSCWCPISRGTPGCSCPEALLPSEVISKGPSSGRGARTSCHLPEKSLGCQAFCTNEDSKQALNL